MILAVNLDRKALAVLDGLFWRLSVVIFLFLVWRIAAALEKARKDD